MIAIESRIIKLPFINNAFKTIKPCMYHHHLIQDQRFNQITVTYNDHIARQHIIIYNNFLYCTVYVTVISFIRQNGLFIFHILTTLQKVFSNNLFCRFRLLHAITLIITNCRLDN